MRMKSVLALTALSAATFLASVAYAADAKQTTTQSASKSLTQKAQTTATEAKTNAENAGANAQTEQADGTAKAVHKGHKKHAHHKKHKKHHHHHNHKHHRHHHEQHRPVFFVYDEIPCWNFLLGGSLGYAAQKETFITRYTRPQHFATPVVLNVNPPIVGLVNNAVLPIYIDHSEKITDQGMLFGLIAGWQYRYNRWLFGAEANVDFQSFEKDRQFAFTEYQENIEATPFLANVGVTGTMLYDRGDIYALTGRVGYFVTPFFMPYLRLGAQLSRDEVQYQVFTNGVVSTIPAPRVILAPAQNFFSDYSSRKKDVYGVVAGVGAEFPTYIGSSTIRLEYNFVKTESVIIDDNTFPIIGNHKFRYPESHIGKMAWIWNFM